jgi:hypothetical protein
LGGGTIEELQIAQSKLTWENLSTQILWDMRNEEETIHRMGKSR